jgi:ADP-ribose pyrophosphatase
VHIVNHKNVFSTPWFNIIEKTVLKENEKSQQESAYYSVKLSDYVCVIPITTNHEIVLVRQYRPVIEAYTLELPSGHLENGESPEETAKRELLEETGYSAPEIDFLGQFMPDVGRLENRMWCYYTPNVTLDSENVVVEEGIEVVLCDMNQFRTMILQGQIPNASHLAALLIALLQNNIIL